MDLQVVVRGNTGWIDLAYDGQVAGSFQCSIKLKGSTKFRKLLDQMRNCQLFKKNCCMQLHSLQMRPRGAFYVKFRDTIWTPLMDTWHWHISSTCDTMAHHWGIVPPPTRRFEGILCPYILGSRVPRRMTSRHMPEDGNCVTDWWEEIKTYR
jgi:hypothetical protein